MNDDALVAHLVSRDLREWADAVQGLKETRLSSSAHGDFARWQSAVEDVATAADTAALKDALMRLHPWRKGPFEIAGVRIDAEWRSDLKWRRIADHIETLSGRDVLDVGGGNGFYALQMQDAGAASVIVVDPTILYAMQFAAIKTRLDAPRVWIIPARLEELPLPARKFDTTFSMGVLYHQRSPLLHLRQLRQTLKPGGQLVLETLYLPGDDPFASTPPDRYARMKNVWLLPTIPELLVWLARSGYRNIDVINASVTSTEEQRTTEWMTFESLSSALDPTNPSLTVEGWPAPRRVVVTATSP